MDAAPVSTGAITQELSVATLAAGLGSEAARLLADRVEMLSVAGGQRVFRQGEEADALYLVVSGAVGISREDARGEERLIARLGPPDSFGELALLVDAPRSASATALRDCVLLRLSRAGFEEALARSPETVLRLARLVAERLRGTPRPAEGPGAVRSATVAVLPATAGVPVAAFARALAGALQGRTAVLEAWPENCDEAQLHALEAAHRHVVYASADVEAPWARLCLRRADHVVLLALPGAPPWPGDALNRLPMGTPWTRRDLVVLQDPDVRLPSPAAPELVAALPGLPSLHLRADDGGDIARLARMIDGRAIGLVLSGGGARGFAHLGALRALGEAGFAVDLVGGTSIGATVGAALAMGWSPQEVGERVVDAFVSSPPLNDYTFPLVALTRGLKAERALQRHFGEARIETLWRPFFCVSTNLTTGAAVVHREGALARALRASIAIPGLLPPALTPEGVLVDGAMIDNLPVGAMASLDRAGRILAVDVAGDAAFLAPSSRRWRTRALRRWLGVPEAMPGVAEILLRAATVSSDNQAGQARARATLVIHPPLSGIELRAWRAYDAIAQIGYEHTCRLIEAGALACLDASPRPA